MKKNNSLIAFYLSFIFTLGFAIYISGMYKVDKLTTVYSKIKRFGDEHRYAIHMTKDYEIKLSKITYENRKLFLED